jgi:L,D-transpeptidase catalytic domain
MLSKRGTWSVVSALAAASAATLVGVISLAPADATTRQLPTTASSSSSPTPAPTATPTPTPTPTPPPKPTPPHIPTTFPVTIGDHGPLVTKVQQRLIWIGLLSRTTGVFDAKTGAAVSTFRDKWGFVGEPVVTASVYKRLDALTHSHGRLPTSCVTARRSLCVDLTQRVLRLVQKGTTILTTDARFGTPQHPTTKGVFHVYRKDLHHISSVYKTPMPYALFFNGGSAVHFSHYFVVDGYYGASHGCVNIRDLAVAKLLFRVTTLGTPVVIYAS